MYLYIGGGSVFYGSQAPSLPYSRLFVHLLEHAAPVVGAHQLGHRVRAEHVSCLSHQLQNSGCISEHGIVVIEVDT